jgi:hypothetical protein
MGRRLALVAALAVVSVCAAGRAVLAAPAAAVRVVVTISARPEGHSLPPEFIGLAVENWTLTNDQFQGSNLGEYLRALGPHGLLRIGGNSLDDSFWTSHGEPRPAWATQGVATPTSLRNLAVALRSTGWRVILGVNLRHYDPARAVDEASYAARILGPRLAAIEPGNEPDHYGISEATYLQRFRVTPERCMRHFQRCPWSARTPPAATPPGSEPSPASRRPTARSLC